MAVALVNNAPCIINLTSAAVSEADKIIAKVTPSMSDFEVLKLFHDEIIKRCNYDKTAQNRNFMYGALVEGRATCMGYAKTFQYLCNRVGGMIPSVEDILNSIRETSKVGGGN